MAWGSLLEYGLFTDRTTLQLGQGLQVLPPTCATIRKAAGFAPVTWIAPFITCRATVLGPSPCAETPTALLVPVASPMTPSPCELVPRTPAFPGPPPVVPSIPSPETLYPDTPVPVPVL